LALACTARIAAEDALLGLPEVRLGLTPGYGGTQRLPRLVGRGRALQMLLWGEPVGAAEALAMGLVNAVAPRSLLLEVCRQWLDKVLANAPLAVALVMEAVDRGCETGLEEGLKIEAAAFALAAATEDRNEGTAAFLAKRRPVFTGE
jgi:enoyl-CoA hydratase